MVRSVVGLLPVAAALFAVPQFLPQLARLRRTGDTAGVSWSWAALTSVNNAAWTGYFALSRLWTALVPSLSATLLAGALAVLLARRGGLPRRAAAATAAWAALLAVAGGLFGRAVLGIALAASFILQTAPSVWKAYRSDRVTGISRGTWLLIFGELLCWGIFGTCESDPRLAVLGWSGVAASLLILARVRPKRPAAYRIDRANGGYCPAFHDHLRGRWPETAAAPTGQPYLPGRRPGRRLRHGRAARSARLAPSSSAARRASGSLDADPRSARPAP
jgi:uncharacterized protein with PQ loop repeat